MTSGSRLLVLLTLNIPSSSLLVPMSLTLLQLQLLLSLCVPPTSFTAEFIPSLQPRPGDVVGGVNVWLNGCTKSRWLHGAVVLAAVEVEIGSAEVGRKAKREGAASGAGSKASGSESETVLLPMVTQSLAENCLAPVARWSGKAILEEEVLLPTRWVCCAHQYAEVVRAGGTGREGWNNRLKWKMKVERVQGNLE
jgi:hypothetical protein